MQFSFNNSLPLVYIFLFLAISIVVAFLYYRNTRTESPKTLLIILRSLFIFFLLLLFISPLLSYIKKEPQKLSPVILSDNSKSLITENRYRELNSYFLHNDNLRLINFEGSLADTSISSFSRNVTDVNNALENVLQSGSAGSVTIVSDGIFNYGTDPLLTARKLQCPVNYILVGDTAQKKDILVNDIYYNRTSFVESRTQIKVQIRSYGYSGTAEVSLFRENNLVEKKRITLDPAQINYEIEFFVTSQKEGFVKYRSEVSEQIGEITEKNNFKEFVIEYLDNKFNVVFIAGGPSSDVAFIKEEISSISNIKSEFYTQKNSNEFYEGGNINFEKKDAIVLIGYPTGISNPNLINNIKDNLNIGTSSLIFVESRNVDYEKLKQFGSFLPFETGLVSNTEEETGLNGVSKSNEYFNIDLSPLTSFSNIFRNRSIINASSNSSSYILSKSGMPALIINSSGTSGSAAFLFHGLYKWKLNPSANYKKNFFGELFLNTLKSVSKKNSQKDVEIFIDRNRLNYNELKLTAKLNGTVPVNDPKVNASIRLNDMAPENVTMNRVSANQFVYIKEINSDVSDIRVYAEITGAQKNYSDSLRIVTDNNYEFRETAASRSQLNELSANSGGMDMTGKTADEVSRIINDQSQKTGLNERPAEYYKRSELKFNAWYLSFMLLFLFIEWIIRKRSNLV
ncbi:hypothetical protein BH10BAC5_BH10BAC5_02830 [soil metagenome]